MRRRSGQGTPSEQLALPLWDDRPPPTIDAPAEAVTTTPSDITDTPAPSTSQPSSRPEHAGRSRPRGGDDPGDAQEQPRAEQNAVASQAHGLVGSQSQSDASPDGDDLSSPATEIGATAGDPRRTQDAIARTSSTAAPRLSELVPRFLEFAAAIDRSPHTLQTTRIDLELLIRHLGDRSAVDVSLDDLRRYTSWLRHDRQNDPRSLRRKVASVKAFFSYLRQTGIRDDNPAEQLIYPASQPHLPEFLETDEAAKLVSAAERPLWRVLILTLLETGLKRDEILALHPADVYVDPAAPSRSYLAVRATNQARRVRARTLPLSVRLAGELRRQIETGAGDRIFPISERAVNAIVETCGQRAGIRKRGPISPQMLRDTFAVREVRRRIGEEERARLSGASDREVMALRLRHDLEVCDLLGLTPSPTNDPISRYRVLATAGSPPIR